ncbi:MFS transporter [Actinoallomurus iriomotensis]|uniref:MFS transporter n=1 Tax=Actinoallomurus iriomotensis TaxID=478107 RepID=A0A9W6S9I5_9ACTN|nr:MFS transporter [Actinoallomurus iriomotensis]GLY89538.1 MFS transporter [Actinoallomurus iriomotensis]
MRRGSLVVLLTGQVMVSMDGSIVTVALPHIRTGLHASDALLQLVTGGYILAMASLVVTGARLGDLYGHRRLFRCGLAGFTAASLACGLAPDGPALVAARFAQGGSAALVLPQVLSLIQLGFSGPARARALGLYSMVLALGVAIGQIAGGLIVSAAGWRPVFLLNVPVGAVLIAVGSRSLPGGRERARSRLDVPGVLVLSTAMTAVVVPLVFGQEEGRPPWTWVCLAAGCAGLAVFAWYERRAASPLLDLGVLRAPGVAPGLFAACAVMGAYTGLIFSLALHLQSGLGLSPLDAGLAFLPYTAGFAAAGLSWPRLPVRGPLPVAGPLVFAAAAPLIALTVRHGWSPLVIPLLVVAGAGHAAGFSPLVERLAATAGPARASAVSALTNTGTLLANTLAIATLGGVYLSARTSAQGLLQVTVLLAALLCLAAAGAWRTVAATATRPPRPAAQPPELGVHRKLGA